MWTTSRCSLSSQYFAQAGPAKYARTMAELPLLLKRDPYRILSLAEIEAIVEAI